MSDWNQDRYATRPAEERDLNDVVRLIHAADAALGLPPEPVRNELAWHWHLPSSDLERDTRMVRDGDDLIAYAHATWLHPEDGGPLHLVINVHPDHRGSGIEARLLSWAEGVASERGSEGTRSMVPDRDEPAKDFLRSRGYVEVRSMYTMRKSLSVAEPAGGSPEGVTIRRYGDADERMLFELNQAAFAEHWGMEPTTLESFNEDLHAEDWDPSLVFLADSDEASVGYVIPFIFETCGWVGMLGVLKEWRGRGIGKALLRRAFAELASRGMSEVRLGVDTQNTDGAVALYEGVGMSVYRRYEMFDRGTPEATEALAGS